MFDMWSNTTTTPTHASCACHRGCAVGRLWGTTHRELQAGRLEQHGAREGGPSQISAAAARGGKREPICRSSGQKQGQEDPHVALALRVSYFDYGVLTTSTITALSPGSIPILYVRKHIKDG